MEIFLVLAIVYLFIGLLIAVNEVRHSAIREHLLIAVVISIFLWMPVILIAVFTDE